MSAIVVLFGPALPGRDAVEHALKLSLPSGTRVIVDDFPTARERRALARGLALTGQRVAYVSWTCPASEAEREIYHHFSAIAGRYADARWTAFVADASAREPPRGEVEPVFALEAGQPRPESLAPIVAWVGAGAPPKRTPRRVLVVEDDPGQRVLLEEALLELGCDVVTCVTAEEALALVGAERFDLVVADHGLPGASGSDLVRALTRIQPELHVAILTGQPDRAIDELGGRRVDVVLAKPVGIVDLIHLVDDVRQA